MTELVEKNLALVHHIVRRRWGALQVRDAHAYDDLVSAGMHGLVSAARGFKPELGFKFTTYAWPSIERKAVAHWQRLLGKDAHRQHVLESSLPRLDDDDAAPLARFEGGASEDIEDKAQRVKQAIRERMWREFPGRLGEMALLRHLEQQTLRQVGEGYRLSPERVRQVLAPIDERCALIIKQEIEREAIA